jgi:cytochrome c oxidase subunit 2
MSVRKAIIALTAFALSACASETAVFSRSGQPASDETTLGLLFGAIGIAVLAVTIGLLALGLLRRRKSASSTDITREGHGARWIVIGGVVTPAIVLVTLFFFVLTTLSSTAQPPKTNLAGSFAIIGHRWWWEVQRVDAAGRQQFVTANEIHIPVGRPVRIDLSSADVIHSFWVPALAGKTDLIPGQVNHAWIEAREPGVYVAQCAEYCGMQHAHMAMRVVAEDDAHFQTWLANQTADAAIPVTAAAREGQDVFLSHPCAVCHQIRGTPAGGIVGPDLTHLATRRTIGAGALPNTAGNLAGWIANSQSIKPGNVMPAMNLESKDLQALVDYLRTLK